MSNQTVEKAKIEVYVCQWEKRWTWRLRNASGQIVWLGNCHDTEQAALRAAKRATGI